MLLYIIVFLCLPPSVVDCCDPHCTEHCVLLDEYALWFVQCLLDCALLWIPVRNSGGKRSVAGWNDGTQTLKADANFWYRVWSEAGCPCTGVLFEIKKKAKHRFKYAVRSLRRQKRSIVRRKLAYKRAHCHSRDFWAEVGRFSKPERRSPPLVVDGVNGDKQIATLWAEYPLQYT